MYSKIRNNILVEFDERDLDHYGRFIVPDGVTEIGNFAFFGGEENKLPIFTECHNLKEVIIPESVIKIGEHAFKSNVGLEKVVLPSGLLELSFAAFTGCKNLKEINLPEGLKVIGEDCFYNCKSLKQIQLPSQIETVGVSVFYGSGVKQITMFGRDIKDEDIIEDLKNSYPFIQYAVKNGKFIPKYNTTMTLTPKKDVPGFFKYSKLWKDIMTAYTERWAEFLQEEFEQKELPDEIREDLYKVCLSLGLFHEGKKQKEVLQFIVKNMFEYNPKEIHQSFNEMTTRLDGYNEEFADFFITNYREPEIVDGLVVRFLEKNLNGEIISNAGLIYNDWDFAVKKAYPNRTVLSHGARASENNTLTEKIVMDLFERTMHYENIHKGNEKLAKMVGTYGYPQVAFERLQEAFDEGKSIKPEDMILTIKPDEIKEGVVFEYLAKNDEEGAILGERTNCCQTAVEAGKECLFYGMSKPNSGFVKFTVDDKIIGQSWIWYNQDTKHICLDNIEIPTVWDNKLKQNSYLTQSFIDCLVRLSKNIVSSMNENGYEVNVVSVGAGYNDLKAIKNFRRQVVTRSPLPADYDDYTDADEILYIIDEHIKNHIQGRDIEPEFTIEKRKIK